VAPGHRTHRALAGPKLTSPANDFQNKLNPVTGRSNDIPFNWAKPSDKVTDYTLEVYTDAAGTSLDDRAGDAAACVIHWTGPEGKVYKLDSFGKEAQLVYDSRDKNILSLARLCLPMAPTLSLMLLAKLALIPPATSARGSLRERILSAARLCGMLQ